jgi:hypothetical protein
VFRWYSIQTYSFYCRLEKTLGNVFNDLGPFLVPPITKLWLVPGMDKGARICG